MGPAKCVAIFRDLFFLNEFARIPRVEKLGEVLVWASWSYTWLEWFTKCEGMDGWNCIWFVCTFPFAGCQIGFVLTCVCGVSLVPASAVDPSLPTSQDPYSVTWLGDLQATIHVLQSVCPSMVACELFVPPHNMSDIATHVNWVEWTTPPLCHPHLQSHIPITISQTTFPHVLKGAYSPLRHWILPSW